MPAMDTASIGRDRGMIAMSTTAPITTGTSASHTCHTDSDATPGSSSRSLRPKARDSSVLPDEGGAGIRPS